MRSILLIGYEEIEQRTFSIAKMPSPCRLRQMQPNWSTPAFGAGGMYFSATSVLVETIFILALDAINSVNHGAAESETSISSRQMRSVVYLWCQ